MREDHYDLYGDPVMKARALGEPLSVAAETFGPLRRYYRPIIGLTGRRGVGKSTAAEWLVERYGFVCAHSFAGGKAMAETYFRRCGAPADIAAAMAHGDLRDVPSPLLPTGTTPRYFMERFGAFMGRDLGPDWTLGAELDRIARDPDTVQSPIVVESVVYEADLIRARGGLVVRIVRPDHAGPAGEKTDAAVAALSVDETIVNDGSIARLMTRMGHIAQSLIGGK